MTDGTKANISTSVFHSHIEVANKMAHDRNPGSPSVTRRRSIVRSVVSVFTPAFGKADSWTPTESAIRISDSSVRPCCFGPVLIQ